LSYVYVSGNDLTGPIPDEVCNLQNSPTNIYLRADCDICGASIDDCCDVCFN